MISDLAKKKVDAILTLGIGHSLCTSRDNTHTVRRTETPVWHASEVKPMCLGGSTSAAAQPMIAFFNSLSPDTGILWRFKLA